ncbi:MAG TPA: efflux RND transporter periplasmic adaptor subunit [Clostridiaceae bacterium]
MNTKKRSSKGLRILARRATIFTMIFSSVIAFSGCSIFPKEEASIAPALITPPKIVYDELDIKNGSIQVQVKGYGSFQSSSLENDFFKYNVGFLKNVTVKVGDNVKKGQLLAEMDTEDLQNNLQKSQISLEMDQLTANSIQADVNSATDEKTKGDATLRLQQQNLKLKLDNLDLANINKQISRAQIYSSIAGQVVFVDAVNPGDRITTYKTLITVADPGKLVLQYSGDNLDKFSLGATVNVTYQEKPYVGKVVGNPASYPIDTSKDTKKVVTIKLDTVPTGIAIGAEADVLLILTKKDNVIVIPRTSVHTSDGRNYIEMLKNGLRVEQDVELGIQNDTDVEIAKGLNVGDKILK